MIKRSEIAPLVNGLARANASFEEQLIEIAGISAADAAKVRAFYIKKKLAKADPIMGRISVKHGAFLGKDVILRAVEMAS
jgi:hypothetical protein